MIVIAIIGLYDIDLWHAGKSAPNLELMQIYNYYNSRNNRVVMIKPNENLTRFKKIFYFKEKIHIALPNALEINLDKGSLIGYGFYGKTPQLKEEIKSLPPSFEPYDIYSYKLSVPKGYDKLKQSSLIRVETNDFGGFNKEQNFVYIADTNFLDTPAAESFLQDNKKHSFVFYNALKVNDPKTYERFYRYTTLFNRRLIINFPYNEDFFYENLKDAVFIIKKKESETELNFLLRLVKTILIYKNKNVSFTDARVMDETLVGAIVSWGKDKNQLSFSEYYKDNMTIQKKINTQPTELRLLLKQNPLKITRSIDLQSNL